MSLEPTLCHKRNHHNEKPTQRSEEQLPLPRLEKNWRSNGDPPPTRKQNKNPPPGAVGQSYCTFTPHLCFWAKVPLGPLSGAFSLPSPTPLAKPGGARHFPAGLWIPPLALTLASHIPLLSLSFCICKMDMFSALEAQCPAHHKAQRRKTPCTWSLVGR